MLTVEIDMRKMGKENVGWKKADLERKGRREDRREEK